MPEGATDRSESLQVQKVLRNFHSGSHLAGQSLIPASYPPANTYVPLQEEHHEVAEDMALIEQTETMPPSVRPAQPTFTETLMNPMLDEFDRMQGGQHHRLKVSPKQKRVNLLWQISFI